MTKNFGSLVKAGFKRGMEEGKKGSTSWRVTWGFKQEPFSGAEELREVELERFHARIDALDPAAREVVEAVTRGLVNKLLHLLGLLQFGMDSCQDDDVHSNFGSFGGLFFHFPMSAK